MTAAFQKSFTPGLLIFRDSLNFGCGVFWTRILLYSVIYNYYSYLTQVEARERSRRIPLIWSYLALRVAVPPAEVQTYRSRASCKKTLPTEALTIELTAAVRTNPVTELRLGVLVEIGL